MARKSGPWRAMTLAGVFMLAACDSGASSALPTISGINAESVTAESVTAIQAEAAEPATLATVLESGLENLVVMNGPVNEDGLLGAGCTVQADEPLPDGDWFGFVLEAHKHQLVVDIACVYGPDTEQFQAYAAEADAPWSSYVVVNDVISEQPLRFGAEAQAYMAADNWQPRPVREVVEEALENPQPGPRGVWLRVKEGRINAVVQPYSMGVAAD